MVVGGAVRQGFTTQKSRVRDGRQEVVPYLLVDSGGRVKEGE